MSEPSLELLKKQINQMTKREVQVDRTKSGKFICRFVDFNMSPIALLGTTEEEAYQKLYQYLKGRKPAPDPELPPAA